MVKKAYSILWFVLLGLFFFESMPSYAADAYKGTSQRFDASRLKSFGGMANVPGILYETKTHDMPYQKESTDADALNKATSLAIGCATLDTGSLMLGVLDNGLSDWEAFIDTDAFRDATAYIFNSPQLPENFMAIETYAHNRAQILTEKCAAFQVEDDMSKVVWQGVQKCVNAKMGGNYNVGNSYEDREDFSKNLADAYMECLNEPLEGGDDSFFNSVKTTLESEKWSGTLYTALARTDFCLHVSDMSETNRCAPLAYLPNIKWCARGEIKLNPTTGRPFCSGDTEDGLYTPEVISPQDVFDIAFSVAEDVVKYGYTIVSTAIAPDADEDLRERIAMSPNELRSYAQIAEMKSFGENFDEGTRGIMGRGSPGDSTYVPSGRYSPGVVDDDAEEANLFKGSASDSSVNIKQFFKYTGCSSEGQGPDFSGDIQEIEYQLKKNPSTDHSSPLETKIAEDLGESLGAAVSGVQFSDDYFYMAAQKYNNFGSDLSSPSEKINTSYKIRDDGSVQDLNAGPAMGLIGAAVACAAVHDMRLSLSDFISIYEEDKGAQAAMLAYRTDLAYMATLRVLNFVRSRLDIARMQMSFSPLGDPNGYPRHVVESVDKLIVAFDARIQALKDRKKMQHDSATGLREGFVK